MELVSQRKFAEIIRTSAQNVNKLVKSGKLPTAKGKIPLDKGLAAYELIKNNSDTNSMSSAIQDSANIGVALAKTKLAKEGYLAKLKQLEYQKLKGEYIAVSEVEQDAQRTATLIRTQLLSLPSRLSLMLEDKPALEIQAILEDEVNNLLKKLNETRFRD
jgi:phage terminase Nu1 subunit (DNA packaging protein)